MSKKLSRREFLLISGLTGFGALLAACRPQPTPVPAPVEKPAEEVEEPAEEVEEPVEEIEPEPEPQPITDRITVEWMNWWGGEREPLMDTVIERFEEEFPHIHVDNQVQPWDARAQRAATAIASGNPPGMLMVTRAEAQLFALEGLIIALDGYAEARGHDLDDVFLASEIEACRFQGQTWSYPLPGGFLESSYWFLNKNVFREAGLDPDVPPSSWQDVNEIVDATTRFEGNALMSSGLFNIPPRFRAWIHCNNGEYFNEDGTRILFNQPEAVETLEWMTDLLDRQGGYEAWMVFWEGLNHESADFHFYQDKLALWSVDNVAAFGHFKTHAPDMYWDTDRWSMHLVPFNANNPQAKPTGVTSPLSWNQVIAARLDAGVRDAAYEWLEFYTMREEGGCWFLLEQGRASPVRRCNENPRYYEMNPYWDVVLEAMQIDKGVPTIPVQSEVQSILNEALGEVWFGRKAPKEALDWAYDEAQPIVDEFWTGT